MKLRAKILLALLAIGLPLVAINAWWIAGQQNRERRRVLDRLHQEAVQATGIMQVFLIDLADRAQQTALHVPGDDRLQAYLRDRLAYLRFWNTGIVGLAWADPAGEVLAGEPADLFRRGVRFAGRETLQSLRHGRGWALDDLVIEEDGERSLGVLRIVARSGVGAANGVMGIRFTPEIFKPLFPPGSLWSRIRLADQAGRLVYATDRLNPSLDDRFGWAAMPGLRDALRDGAATVRTGRIPDNGEGKEWMAVHVPIPQVGWVATALIPTAEAMSESRHALYGELAIQAVLVTVCTAAALVLAHRVARPASRLAEAARRIAAGDRTVRVGLTGRSELEAVGGAFDQMSETLDASWEALKAERDAAEVAAARFATLSRLAGLIGSSLDPSQVFDFIAEATSYLLDGAVVLLLVADAEQGSLSLRSSHGVTRRELRLQSRYRPGEGLPGWVFQTREPLVLTNLLEDARTLNRAWAEAEGLRAFAAVPLLLRDRCLGVLYAARGGERPFAEQDVDLLKSFAAHAATAIQNAHLYNRAESEAQRLRAVLESMPAAVIVGEGRPEGRTFRLVMGNRAWIEMQGISEFRLGDHPPDCELLGPDGSPVDEAELPLQRAIWRGEATKEKEMILRLPDGRQRSLLVNAVPFPEANGIRQAVCMMLDVTERRQAEEELKRLAADNADLYRQAAQEARVKGLLLDELNHRVRNNLALIVSFMELQRTTSAGRMAGTVLEEAIGRVKGLALIHNVLGGAGFQAGQYEALVRRLAEQTFLQGPPSGRVEFRLEKHPLRLPSKTLTALGIITNELFTNIAKHAFPDGHMGTVEVSAEAVGPEVIIRIRDNGVRLPPGVSDRSDRLGLRLVRSLVEVSLQGTFTLEAGEGTTAIIRFPVPADDGQSA